MLRLRLPPRRRETGDGVVPPSAAQASYFDDINTFPVIRVGGITLLIYAFAAVAILDSDQQRPAPPPPPPAPATPVGRSGCFSRCLPSSLDGRPRSPCAPVLQGLAS